MPSLKILSLAAVAVFATAAHAAEPTSATTPTAPRPTTDCAAPDSAVEPLPLGAGLRAFVDPTTGQLRQPSPEELASVAASARLARNKSIAGLEVEYRKDGSKFVDSQGRFMHFVRVTRNPDGTTNFTCTDRDPHALPESNQTSALPAPAEK
jgi:hypothetical protein